MTRADSHLLVVNFTSFFTGPVLRAARERNVRVTVVGPDEAFGAFPEIAAQADGRIVASLARQKRTLLLERLACVHRAEPFTGVLVSREDSVAAAADVAAHLGLAWNTPAAVRRMRNKWLTRQTLAQAGFRQPDHHLCASEADLTQLLTTAPDVAWVTKPLCETGSRGVSLVARPEETAAAVEHVRAAQPTGPFLAEHALHRAREFSVEGVWLGNRPHVLAITAKQTSGPPHFVELGHTLPAALDPSLDAAVRDIALRGLIGLDASHGLFHVEVFADDAGVVFGVAHARAGGDRITQLLELAGVDLYGLALDSLIGRAPHSVSLPKRVAAVRYFRFPPGRLKYLAGIEALANAADVVHCSVDVRPGDYVHPVLHSFARHGCFVITGDEYAATSARADALRESVLAQVES
jgi:biotin carboxylase